MEKLTVAEARRAESAGKVRGCRVGFARAATPKGDSAFSS